MKAWGLAAAFGGRLVGVERENESGAPLLCVINRSRFLALTPTS